MNISFLQKISSLTGPALHKVATLGSDDDHTTAGRLLHTLLDGLPELLAAAVIDVEQGQLLASYTTMREFNPQKIAGFNAEVIKQQRMALIAFGMEDEQPEEILITLRSQLHLLRLLGQGQRVLYVAVDCRDTNLGIAREVLSRCTWQ